MVGVGWILEKVKADRLQVEAKVAGYRETKLLAWLTPRRMAFIGIGVSLAGVLMAVLLR
jgi:hypothetical protein